MDYIKDSSLVLDLPLYELDGSSFMSCDAYGHLCTDTGAVWTLQGRTFDGVDDEITIPDNPSLYHGGSCTQEYWIKIPADIGEQILLCKDDAGANREWLSYYRTATKKIEWALWADTPEVAVSQTNIMPLNGWVHIALRYDGVDMRTYTNGVLDCTPQAQTGLITDTNAQIEVGARNAAQFLGGTVGEIRLYNRALTTVEIQHNYLATKERYR